MSQRMDAGCEIVNCNFYSYMVCMIGLAQRLALFSFTTTCPSSSNLTLRPRTLQPIDEHSVSVSRRPWPRPSYWTVQTTHVCGNSSCHGGSETLPESGHTILSDKLSGTVHEAGICPLWRTLETGFDGLERERERKVINEPIDESRDEEEEVRKNSHREGYPETTWRYPHLHLRS